MTQLFAYSLCILFTIFFIFRHIQYIHSIQKLYLIYETFLLIITQENDINNVY